MTHVALSGYTGQLATHTIDEHLFADATDIFGTSTFPEWLMGNDPVEHLFNLEAVRSAAGSRPYWQAELQGGKGRRDGTKSTPHPSGTDVALWMWGAAASGASGVMFWQWRPELLGPESPGYGLCTPDGGTSPRLSSASKVARDLLSGFLEGMTLDRARVGILVSRRTALHAFATDRSMEIYTRAAEGAFRLLADQDLHVTLTHEDALAAMEPPMALYWPMPTVCSDELASSLERYVREGGTLVAEASPGEHDEHGRHRPGWPDGVLGELFGARVIDNDIVPSALVSLGDGSLAGEWRADSIEVTTARPIGYFADGTVGITLQGHGAGRAILVGTYPSLHYGKHRDPSTRSAVAQLLGATTHEGPALASWREPQPGLFSRYGVSARGEPLVIFLNWTSEAQVVDCQTSCMVLGHDPGEDGPVAKGPGDVLVPSHGSVQMIVRDFS
jgi:beta-galactosidase